MSTAIHAARSLAPAASGRLESIDCLRGLVMVLMAIDHIRDYFTNTPFDPMDPTRTHAALFFTRWITHFCAPVFLLLTGTGAFLYGERRPRRDLVYFLVTRGPTA